MHRRAYRVEDQEAGCDREQSSLAEGSDAIGNGTHGMLSDAPVDVPAGIAALRSAGGNKVWALEIDLSLPPHVSAGREIACADHEVVEFGGK